MYSVVDATSEAAESTKDYILETSEWWFSVLTSKFSWALSSLVSKSVITSSMASNNSSKGPPDPRWTSARFTKKEAQVPLLAFNFYKAN